MLLISLNISQSKIFKQHFFRTKAVFDIQKIPNENNLSSSTDSNTVFPYEIGQNKTPFLPGELWEEIKSLIYSESNGGR